MTRARDTSRLVSTQTGIAITLTGDPIILGVGNTELVRITGSGNVGIGITNPQYKLDVHGTGQFTTASSSSATTDAAIYANTPLQTVSAFFGQLTSTTGLTGDQYSTSIRFNGSAVNWGDLSYYPNQGGTGHFRFSLAGSTVQTSPNASLGVGALCAVNGVGIGTTLPSYTTGTSALRVVGLNSTSNTLGAPASITNIAPFYGGANFNTGNLSLFTSPSYNALGLVSRLTLGSGDGSQVYLESHARDTTGSFSDFVVATRNSGTPDEKLRITSSGNVGIGITNPTSLLEVQGGQFRIRASGTYSDPADNVGVIAYDSTGGDLNISARSNGGNTAIAFRTSNSGTGGERVRITSTGNVGIGTNNPQQKLDVLGNILGNGLSGYGLGASSGKYYYFDNFSGNNFIGLESTNTLGVYVGGNLGLRITSGGNVGIGTTNPGTKLHVSGGNIKVDSGYGIDFSADPNGGTVASEVLDDYEEGTFTASINYHTDVTNVSSTNGSHTTTGYYVKVGNMCHCTVYLSSATSTYVYKSISGLPFTSATSYSFAVGTFYFRGSRMRYGGSTVTDCYFYSGISASSTVMGLGAESLTSAFSGWPEGTTANQSIGATITYRTT